MTLPIFVTSILTINQTKANFTIQPGKFQGLTIPRLVCYFCESCKEATYQLTEKLCEIFLSAKDKELMMKG